MPSFGQISKDRLSQCHPDLQTLFNEVINYFDCTIAVGHRGKIDQETAFSKGLTKLHYPNSKHNTLPSKAVDVYPCPVDFTNKKYNDDCYFFGGFVEGVAKMLKKEGKIKSNIRYGGDWNRNNRISDETFIDPPHFEIDD